MSSSGALPCCRTPCGRGGGGVLQNPSNNRVPPSARWPLPATNERSGRSPLDRRPMNYEAKRSPSRPLPWAPASSAELRAPGAAVGSQNHAPPMRPRHTPDTPVHRVSRNVGRRYRTGPGAVVPQMAAALPPRRQWPCPCTPATRRGWEKGWIVM